MLGETSNHPIANLMIIKMTFHLYCLSKSFQIPIIDKMTNLIGFPKPIRFTNKKPGTKKIPGYNQIDMQRLNILFKYELRSLNYEKEILETK